MKRRQMAWRVADHVSFYFVLFCSGPPFPPLQSRRWCSSRGRSGRWGPARRRSRRPCPAYGRLRQSRWPPNVLTKTWDWRAGQPFFLNFRRWIQSGAKERCSDEKSVLCRSRRELPKAFQFHLRKSASIQPRTSPVKFARSTFASRSQRRDLDEIEDPQLAFPLVHDEAEGVAKCL